MRITNAEFITSIGKVGKYKGYSMPEITFVGRSNVGKSSLINALTNNGKLAKTSSSAGRTRLVNLFLINKKFVLVDLPGYGYAKAGKEAQKEWQGLIEDYLQQSNDLKVVFVLVDIRIKPSEQDKQMLEYLYYYNMPFKIVATKADKLSKSQINNNIHMIASELKVGDGDIIAVSAQNKSNLDAILDYIETAIDYEKLVPNLQLIDSLQAEKKRNRENKKIEIQERKQKENKNSNYQLKNKNSKQKVDSQKGKACKNGSKMNNKIDVKGAKKTSSKGNTKFDAKAKNIEKPAKKTPRYILNKRKVKK